MTGMTIEFLEGGGMTLDVVLSDAGTTTGGTGASEDLIARAAARAAAMSASLAEANAAANKLTIEKNARSLATLEAARYAARLTVWPPSVAQHSDFQRDFKAILNELNEQILRLDGGATGTRFVNRFQIKTRNADRAEVLLHDDAWSFTTEGAQELEWDVDAAEFNRLGTTIATDYLEVWGEFRAVYGGGVNEKRGSTQPFVIAFGGEDEFPATQGRLRAALLPRVETITAEADFEREVKAQLERTTPLWLFLAVAIDRVIDGHRHQWKKGLLLYIAPRTRHETAEILLDFPDILARLEGGNTQVQQIALLSLTMDPPGIAYRSADELAAALKLITVGINNPTVLTGDVWVEGTTQGQPSLARRKWATNIAGLPLEVTNDRAKSIADSAAAPGGTDTLSIRLRFYDAANGGNEIERIGRNIPLVDRRDVAALDARNPTDLAAVAFNAQLALDWDAAAGPMRAVTLTADTTIAFSNVSPGDVLLLEVTQDATGGRGITWPASVEWANETEIEPSSDGGAVDLFTLLALGANRVLADAKLNIG